MKLPYFQADGSEAGEKEFPGFPVFEGEKGRMAVRQAVLALRANQRQGTASTKTRAEVSGSGKKPFRQKGTGMARRGSSRSPLMPGGGIVFGPRPRDYSQKVNRKVRRLALARALFERGRDRELLVIASWELPQPKTRDLAAVLDRLHPSGKLLLADAEVSESLALSARNLQRVRVTAAADLNVYDALGSARLVLTEAGLTQLLARMNGGNEA
jgi:large subunit ribosomal protein L4